MPQQKWPLSMMHPKLWNAVLVPGDSMFSRHPNLIGRFEQPDSVLRMTPSKPPDSTASMVGVHCEILTPKPGRESAFFDLRALNSTANPVRISSCDSSFCANQELGTARL